MVKHIVMWTFKEELNQKEIEEAKVKIKADIEGLKDKVKQIIDINIYYNINPDEKYDVVLVGTFKSLEDVKRYAQSPEHLAVVPYIKSVTYNRSAIDFNI